MGTQNNGVMFCGRHFFVVKYSKTTSNVLNFDVNTVNIDCFLHAGGDKVGSQTDVEFTLV